MINWKHHSNGDLQRWKLLQSDVEDAQRRVALFQTLIDDLKREIEGLGATPSALLFLGNMERNFTTARRALRRAERALEKRRRELMAREAGVIE